jgi:hypothetical protein
VQLSAQVPSKHLVKATVFDPTTREGQPFAFAGQSPETSAQEPSEHRTDLPEGQSGTPIWAANAGHLEISCAVQNPPCGHLFGAVEGQPLSALQFF